MTLLSLLLVGCVTQDQADVKMANGCIAGVNALISSNGKKIDTIKAQRYANETSSDGAFRRVTIEAVEKDGWLELDKQYSCLFEQQWGPFKMSHSALLMQVSIDDEIIGKKDSKILGSIEDFSKLSAAVADALRQ
jgi:hypothetical protein